MRRTRAVLLMIVGALALAPTGAHAAGSLLGQWPLDGSYEDGATQGTADVSGNGLHLKAPAGSIHLGPPAMFGPGATLNSSKTPLEVTSPLLAPAQLSLVLWIKQTGNPGTLRYIAGRGDDAFTCSGSTFALYSGYPAGVAHAGMPGLRFYVRTGPTGVPALTDAPVDTSVFDGRWHLVAGTYDGSAARLFVDGVQIGPAKPAPGPLTYALGGRSSFYVDGYSEPGCSGADGDDWPGPIDDVRLYDRALSAGELGRLAAAPGPESPLLITDESLIQAMPVPVTPAPAPGPGAGAQAGAQATKGVAAEQMTAALAGLAGASKKEVKTELKDALKDAQTQALEAMQSAASNSKVGVAETLKELSSKEAKAVKPDEKVQARLEALKYGVEVRIPTTKPGQIVEAAVTLALEKKQGGKVKVQQITLPPAVGIAGPDGKSATIQVPVDNKATEAMTKSDVAKAAVGVQAATLDSLSDLSQEKQLRLQQVQDVYAKQMDLLSNVLKKINETQSEITQNLKGGVSKSEQKEQRDLKDKAAKLDQDAKKIEAQRDAANQKATQAMDAAVNAMITSLAGAAAQIGGAATGGATKIPIATTVLTGCSLCKLGAASSN